MFYEDIGASETRAGTFSSLTPSNFYLNIRNMHKGCTLAKNQCTVVYINIEYIYVGAENGVNLNCMFRPTYKTHRYARSFTGKIAYLTAGYNLSYRRVHNLRIQFLRLYEFNEREMGEGRDDDSDVTIVLARFGDVSDPYVPLQLGFPLLR